MKRIFFSRYNSSGKFPDGRVKLDVYFRDSSGEMFVWTPDWEHGTRNFFLEASRVERLNVPTGAERERFRQVAQQVLEEEQTSPRVNYRLLGTKLGEGLKYSVSINEIGRVASAVFDFEAMSHPHPSITSSRSQLIYDWVMTLGEQEVPIAANASRIR